VTGADEIAWAALFASTSGPSSGWRARSGTLTSYSATNNITVGVDRTSSALLGFRSLYFRVSWPSSNLFSVAFSDDGNTWIQSVGSVSHTMTPTHFGVIASTSAGTSPLYVTCDYVRVYDADLIT
jgi:hypothetical protein